MSGPHDDQSEWENRQQDAKWAREKSASDAALTRGFSHNTDALYALYGLTRPTDKGPSEACLELIESCRSAMFDTRQRILDRLGTWKGLSATHAEAFREQLTGIDLTNTTARAELDRLKQKVEETDKLWSQTFDEPWRAQNMAPLPPFLGLRDPLGELQQTLRDFKKDLRTLSEWCDEYQWALRHAT
jgi:hypothetical protein